MAGRAAVTPSAFGSPSWIPAAAISHWWGRTASPALVTNGEIYNHRQLREELGLERFTTGSDSEAALHALLVDAPAGLTRLRGMFTLAYLDETGSLLVARDALGVKPLYWARREDCTLFASELRAFGLADRPLVESFPWDAAGRRRAAWSASPTPFRREYDLPGVPGRPGSGTRCCSSRSARRSSAPSRTG
ncbi:hypothetical protein R6L23_15425 [Streptomyces sp. SR27]|uniref:hypothetical protein n=1 Tax=Streptomyces sp. SR27 TaxID=3076630 RepID=UPI00295BBE34|nr:hypothetical protein [Streptomyces sp. SR27]MDV9189587.1 hypothetical protein [Streptomyces sp. SR27]